MTQQLRTGWWAKLTFALAVIIAGLMALGGDASLAACSPPGDHWRYYSSTSKAYFDFYGYTACFSAGINPNWCRREYRVTKFTIDPMTGNWTNAGYYYTSIKCYWYD
jgi:hypothetical protein